MVRSENKDKDLILHALKYAHLFVTVGIFAFCWAMYLKFNDIVVAFRYHIFVMGLFAVFYFLFVRIYNGYMVGLSSKSDIVLAQTLADCFSVVIAYVSIHVVWNKIHSPVWFLICILLLFLFNLHWTSRADAVYFRLNEPRSTAIIYRDTRDLERLGELKLDEKNFKTELKLCIYDYNLPQLFEMIKSVDAVFIVGIDEDIRNEIVKYCVQHCIEGYFLPHLGDIIIAGAKHVQAFSIPVESAGGSGIAPEYALFKRLADILVSSIGIIICSPILLFTAIAIKLDDFGPVFYKQIRLTRGGRRFYIYKFRSMRVDAEADGQARLAKENDERITRIGRLIRKCRIDELPQLFNVLKGDMTLVGPRPERPEIAAQYEKELPAFNMRLQVKAGLTGYAQVYGRYNTDPYDKLQFDLLYITKMSPIVDLQIMAATIQVLFKKESTRGV